MTCMFCDGPLLFLGTLGVTEYFRCQDCGLNSRRMAHAFHNPSPDPDELEERAVERAKEERDDSKETALDIKAER